MAKTENGKSNNFTYTLVGAIKLYFIFVTGIVFGIVIVVNVILLRKYSLLLSVVLK